MTAQRVIVISDIHLGAQNGFDLFSAGEQLAAFLRYHADLAEPLDLVLLGDIPDYLQIEPFLCFTEEQAIAKTKLIIEKNALVFAEMAAFIKEPGKRIRWMIGNHDLELLFPAAQELIDKALSGDQQRDQLLWEVDKERLDYPIGNGRVVRLVHGNRYDPWNAVDYDALRALVKKGGDKDYGYPPGSRLVAKVLNPLKDPKRPRRHRYVDLLKPEKEVALPLALALWPDESRRLLKDALGLVTANAWSGAVKAVKDFFRRPVKAFGPGDAKTTPLKEADLLAYSLRQAASGENSNELGDDFALWFEGGDVASYLASYLKPRPAAFAATNWYERAITALLRSVARHNAAGTSAFNLDVADENDPFIQETFKKEPRVHVLVAGHTHLARAVSYDTGYAFNTGTWADLMRLPMLQRGEFQMYAHDLIEIFEKPDQAPAAHRPFQRLTYLDLDLRQQPNGRPMAATLKQWLNAPSLTLHQFP